MHRVFIWLLDALPDISNLILVLVGVLMSMPKLAEDIEKRKPIRYSVASCCIGIGVAGFIVGINQKQHLNSDITELVNASTIHKAEQRTLQDKLDQSLLSEGRMEAQLRRMSEVVGRSNYPGVAQIAAAVTRELGDKIHDQPTFSTALLIDTGKKVGQRMRDLQKALSSAETESGRKWVEGQLQATIVDANYLREQMIQRLLGQETDEDKAEAASFGAALTGDRKSFNVDRAASYLDNLANRDVPTAPSNLTVTTQ
jgi:hypothetical protein